MSDNTNTIQLTLQVKDDGTIVIDKAAGKIKDLEGATDKGTTSANSFGEGWMGVTAKIAATTAAIYTAKKAFDFMEEGVKAAQIENTFMKVTQASGIMGDSLIEDIKRASGVFVDETELMIKAQRALVEGLDPQQIVQLTEASRTAARMMGITVKDSFNMIMESVISLRTRGLRPAFPDIKEENELFIRLGETLGVQADRLTVVGQRQAIVNEILRENTEVLKILGPLQEDQYEKMQRIRSIWAEAYEDLSKVVGKTWEWVEAGKALTSLREFSAIMAEAIKLKEPAPGNKVEIGLPELPTKTKKEGLVKPDPFEMLYGQTEAEMKAGIERKRKLDKEWMEAYIGGWDVKYDRIEEVYVKIADGVFKLKEVLVTDYGVPKASEESERNLRILLAEEKYRDQVTDAINRQSEALIQLGLGFEQPTDEDKLNRLRKEAALREEIADKRLEAEKKINAEIERLGLGFESPTEEYGIAHLTRQATELETAWQNAAEGVADIWASNFSIMRRSGESFGDWFKNMWLDIADYAIGQIWRMAVSYALLGETGKYKAGAGILGMIGNLFAGAFGAGAGAGGAASMGAVAAQGGFEGWVNRPTLFMAGEGGRREFASITPENKMKESGGNTYIYNIDASGAQKGVSVEILRALRETENRAVKRSINEVADLKLRGGKFSKIFGS